MSSCRLANITASSLSLTCQRPDVAAAGTTLYRAEVRSKHDTQLTKLLIYSSKPSSIFLLEYFPRIVTIQVLLRKFRKFNTLQLVMKKI